ncbi:MAG: hypothetical protein KC561_21505 [Myxococcales bacterium]|nr:hypothetical protein [Myxococcales bacterium]
MDFFKQFEWRDNEPVVIIIVVLVLAFALLAPSGACQGSVDLDAATGQAPIQQLEPAQHASDVRAVSVDFRLPTA